MTEKETVSSNTSEESSTPDAPPSSKDTDSSPPPSPTYQSEQERITAISDLLNGDEENQPDQPAELPAGLPDEEPTPDVEPETINEKAEELGVSAEDLYHLKVKTRDGQEVSVEELKDFYADSQGRDAELNSRDAEIIQRQQVLLAAAQAGKLSEAGFTEVKHELDERVRAEQSKFLDLVPELQDEAKLEVFSRDVERVMSQFGYKRHEMMFTDHRQALFVRRFAQLERELEAERAKTKPKPQTARKPNGRGAHAPSQPRKPGPEASKQERLNYISGLLQKG